MTEAQHHTRNEEKTYPKYAIKVTGRVTRLECHMSRPSRAFKSLLIGPLPSLFLRFVRKMFLE